MSKRNFQNERVAVEMTVFDGAERFVIIVVDVRAWDIRRTGKPFTEAEAKVYLRSDGIPGHDVDTMIAEARARHEKTPRLAA